MYKAWPLLAGLALASCDPSPFEGTGSSAARDDKSATRSDRMQASHAADGGESESDAGSPPPTRSAEAGRAGQDGRKARAGSPSAPAAGAKATAGQQASPAGMGGEQASAGASGSAGQPADTCQRADTDAPVSLGELRDAGTVSSPASVVLRVPGTISWIGGKLIWLFPKTMGTTGADAAPNQPNAAFVTRDDPTKLEEDLDPDGVPRRFLTADDTAPATELWPTALLRVAAPMDQDPAGGVAFIRRVAADLSYDVVVGRVARNTTNAQEPLAPLFTGAEPKFSTGAYRGSEYAYLFACDEDLSVPDRADPKHFPCKLARAKVSEIEQHDSYRVYDPKTDSWLSDLSAGGPVLFGAASTLSLSHNNYLGRYLAIHSRWFSNEVSVHSAKSPWGPWREEFTISLPTPAVNVIQAAVEQPALLAPMECASSIWISYMSPTAEVDGYPSQAKIKLVRAELK